MRLKMEKTRKKKKRKNKNKYNVKKNRGGRKNESDKYVNNDDGKYRKKNREKGYSW